MTPGERVLVIGGVGIGAWLLFSKTVSAAGLKKAPVTGSIRPGVTTSLRPGQLTAGSATGNFLGDLLKGLLGKGDSKGGSSGGGSGAGGNMAAPSKNVGGNATNTNGRGNAGNFGDYVINGQVYDAFGNGIDADGRIMPGVFDNSGQGPAGAGLDWDGSLASNPLEFGLGSPLYGVVAPLNNPDAPNSGYLYAPGDLGTGDSQGLLAQARSGENAPDLGVDLTTELLPSSTPQNLNMIDPSFWPADEQGNNDGFGVPIDASVSDVPSGSNDPAWSEDSGSSDAAALADVGATFDPWANGYDAAYWEQDFSSGGGGDGGGSWNDNQEVWGD